jgi:hypothetical protein
MNSGGIACVHVLPLEYYPPVRNLLELLTRANDWRISVWTTRNSKGISDWECNRLSIERPNFPRATGGLLRRVVGCGCWHLRVAWRLARLKPDIVVSVEPHSALAVWIYRQVFRGKATLFIHHHEYYSPDDLLMPGNRTLRPMQSLERKDLFPSAVWVSQTNVDRLRMLREWNPGIQDGAARVFPNYPPQAWIDKVAAVPENAAEDPKLRLIYVGSASLEDTFICEIAHWVALHPAQVSLHVCGNNIRADVWEQLRSLKAGNISLDERGADYADLPGLLPAYDVGLILYKGNTLNFVYNVPNKAIEYLACGLEVWYPMEMEGMRSFQRQHPERSLREMDFKNLPAEVPRKVKAKPGAGPFPFTCETAMAPMVDAMRAIYAKAANGPNKSGEGNGQGNLCAKLS